MPKMTFISPDGRAQVVDAPVGVSVMEIAGNVFDNNWADAQVGFAIVFTPRNQDGTAPWTVVQDVQFTNNVVRHVSSGINLLGSDDIHSSQLTSRIRRGPRGRGRAGSRP